MLTAQIACASREIQVIVLLQMFGPELNELDSRFERSGQLPKKRVEMRRVNRFRCDLIKVGKGRGFHLAAIEKGVGGYWRIAPGE